MFSFAVPGLPSFGDLAWHAPVEAAQLVTVPLPANTMAPAAGISVGQTLTANANGDLNVSGAFGGNPVAAGDRVLLLAELNPHNGIWVVISTGSATSRWLLVRATDANTATKLPTGSVVGTLTGGVDGNGGRALFWQTGPAGGGWSSFPDEIEDLIITRSLSVPMTGSTTPAVNNGGTATYSSRICKWTQIGSLVVFRIKFVVSANGSGAVAVSITGTGLPTSGDAFYALADRAGVGVQPLVGRMTNVGAELTVNSIRTVAASTVSLTGADLLNGASYSFAGAYLTA